MKRSNARILLIRAANSKGLPHALVAGLLLFGSSCTSARQLATRFGTSPDAASKDPFVRSDGDITHADLITRSGETTPVTPLGHETSPKNGAGQEHLARVPAESPAAHPGKNVAVAAAESPSSAPRTFPVQRNESVPDGTSPDSPRNPPAYPNANETADPFLAAASATVHADLSAEAAPAAAPTDTVRQVSAEERDRAVEAAINFYPAEQRVPLSPAICPPAGGRPFPPPSAIGDEYVCDGGDRGLPVGPHGPMGARLDPEDTVAKFTDHLGREHVVPSNRTCVYAPRFAAVRTVSEPVAGHAVDRAAGAHEGTPLAGVRSRSVLDEEVQRERLQGARTWARASGVESELSDESVVKNDRHELHVKLLGPHQVYAFIRDGELDKVDAAFLQVAIAAAFDWSGRQAPMVYAADVAGQEVQARAMSADVTGTEDRRTPGRLTLLKVADRKSAQPGDVVTFTLRFENTGDRELLNVRVVDNLTNRLKLIEDSIESSANGELNVTPNGSGGTILTFQLTDPLPGHSGGHIVFKCTVL